VDRDDDELRELRFERLDFEQSVKDAVDEGDRATRTFDEVMVEHLFRGDIIRVMVGERAWTGRVVHVGAEVMTLETSGGIRVDLTYDGLGAVRVVERSSSGGRGLAGPHPGTMAARLRELFLTEESIEIGGFRLEAPLRGTVTAVAESHVEFRTADGGDWVVPLSSIGYLVRQADEDRA
jgi:hypothetical protein